jgi:hypothetical protein
MTTKLPVVAFTLGVGLVLSLGACTSDDVDDTPATETPASVAEDVASGTDAPNPGATDTGAADTNTVPSTTVPSTTVPSTGLGSIDGPATVDPDFGGANPEGGDDGG